MSNFKEKGEVSVNEHAHHNENLETDATVIADVDLDEARAGTESEKHMTLREGLRLYPAAIFWSMLLSTAVIMEGFDLTLLGSFLGFPEFVKYFGEQRADGTYNISASWQSGLMNGAVVGEIIGLFINGIVAEKIGYKKTMIGALSMMIATIFIPFFAKSIHVLLMGQILQGIPWGIFQTLSTSYAAEVCPTVLRSYLTTYVNLCWIIGQLIASCMLRGVLQIENKWGFKIPYALQWLWPVPILIGTLFAPESPWWLVRQDRPEDAKKVLRRLQSSKNTNSDPDKIVSMMVHTNAMEKEISAGTSYLDCFKGVDLRRTEIACGVWVCQNVSGSAFMGYSVYFLQQAGFSPENAFNMQIGQYALGFIGTVGAWALMTKLGRRTLYVYGLLILFVLLVVIGCLGTQPNNNGAVWGVGVMLLVYTFFYDITIGPVCYALVAEISSTRLRTKTIVLARNAYNISGIINNVIMPEFLNIDKLNWGAKTGFFWAGVAALCFTWSYFRLPEPKGRTYGELDVLFERKISARKFKETVVDQYAEGHETKPKIQNEVPQN